jgi:hypothetical protein
MNLRGDSLELKLNLRTIKTPAHYSYLMLRRSPPLYPCLMKCHRRSPSSLR